MGAMATVNDKVNETSCCQLLDASMHQPWPSGPIVFDLNRECPVSARISALLNDL